MPGLPPAIDQSLHRLQPLAQHLRVNQGFGGAAGNRPRGAPPPGPEEQLMEKPRRIDALHARPGSEGDRDVRQRKAESLELL